MKTENSQPYGLIIMEIYRGNNTLSLIAEKLNKSKPTIKEQLETLLENKYIERRPIERDGQTIQDNFPLGKKQRRGSLEIASSSGYSFKYSLRRKQLVRYWHDNFKALKKEFDEKLALEKFDDWMNGLGSFFPSTVGKDYPVTINVIGHFFLSQQRLWKEIKKNGIAAFLDRPLKDLLLFNKNENILLGKRFIKKAKKGNFH